MIYPPNHRQSPYHGSLTPPYTNRPGSYGMPQKEKKPMQQKIVKGINGLNKTLEHVQSFANMMETAGPIIEKYKPLVKNIPMMIQMVKAMQASEGEAGEKVPATIEKDLPERPHAGLSKPKLYIE